MEEIRKTAHSEESGVSRRGFLAGLSLGGIAVAGALAGCSPGSSSTGNSAVATNEPNQQSAPPTDIVETIDADIVVVGAGISGLSAAVQAAQDGNKVIILEKGANAGGNGMGTEGVFAVNSTMQQEQGIHITPAAIVSKELEQSQYRVDGSMWMDLIENSADNIAWLQENGVVFSGVVDNYHTGLFSTMHWFEESAGAISYVPQMQAAAEGYGAEFRMNTRATQLIHSDGVVSGLYAIDGDDNNIQVNAKAVILASGGIGLNKELLFKQGWEQAKLDEMMLMCVPTVEGDGYNMAMEAAAKDFLNYSANQAFIGIKAFGTDTTPPYSSPLNGGNGIAGMGPVLWVNQDARRFNNEGITHINMASLEPACQGNRETYAIFDQAAMDAYVTDPEDIQIVTDALSDAENDDSIFASDSFAALAEHFGLDVDTFSATVERYNSLCAEGKDSDFGKDAEFMQTLSTPPYYIAKIISLLVVIIGAITTNRRFEVIDDELNTIPGLYAVGLDGAMMHRNVYTQNMPGSNMGNNVNSGRYAAINAKEYIMHM